MPESARWLHSVGKIEKCENALKKIARINGKGDIGLFLCGWYC